MYEVLCSTLFYNIRIYHECEDGIEKSVQKITHWHHEICLVMINGDREGRIFLSQSHTKRGLFFLLTTWYLIWYLKNMKKVRKETKIRYQVSHLTQDTTQRSEKNTWKITQESQKVSPFLVGDHKATMNDRKAWRTRNTNNIKDPQKKHCLGTVSNKILLEGLN